MDGNVNMTEHRDKFYPWSHRCIHYLVKLCGEAPAKHSSAKSQREIVTVKVAIVLTDCTTRLHHAPLCIVGTCISGTKRCRIAASV